MVEPLGLTESIFKAKEQCELWEEGQRRGEGYCERDEEGKGEGENLWGETNSQKAGRKIEKCFKKKPNVAEPNKMRMELIIFSVRIELCVDLDKSHFCAMVETQVHWDGANKRCCRDEKVEPWWQWATRGCENKRGICFNLVWFICIIYS